MLDFLKRIVESKIKAKQVFDQMNAKRKFKYELSMLHEHYMMQHRHHTQNLLAAIMDCRRPAIHGDALLQSFLKYANQIIATACHGDSPYKDVVSIGFLEDVQHLARKALKTKEQSYSLFQLLLVRRDVDSQAIHYLNNLCLDAKNRFLSPMFGDAE